MKKKWIILIFLLVSVAGMLPKLFHHKNTDNWAVFCYFAYLLSSLLVFYFINHLFFYRPRLLFVIKYWGAFFVGFFYLSLLHACIYTFSDSVARYFFNLSEITFAGTSTITLFRAVIIQTSVFLLFLFLKVRTEKNRYGVEVDELKAQLNKVIYTEPLTEKYSETIATRYRNQIIPVGVSDIAFFFLSDGVVFQFHFSGDRYIQNTSLDELESTLPPTIFYRANRQFLVQKKAVKNIEQIENRKLKLILALPSPHNIIVSKAKSSDFTKWLMNV